MFEPPRCCVSPRPQTRPDAATPRQVHLDGQFLSRGDRVYQTARQRGKLSLSSNVAAPLHPIPPLRLTPVGLKVALRPAPVGSRLSRTGDKVGSGRLGHNRSPADRPEFLMDRTTCRGARGGRGRGCAVWCLGWVGARGSTHLSHGLRS